MLPSDIYNDSPYIQTFPEFSPEKDYKSENQNFVSALLFYFGSEPATTAADFLSRADDLDTVQDLVGKLRKYHGNDVAMFAMGFFGGGGELPETSKKNYY
jgi:hypothetical protein